MPGNRLKDAMAAETPLQIVGTIHAYAAKLAQQVGFKAIYLSGAGVANAEFGLPDLAMTSLNDVLTSVERITDACELPLLVDADTGWGSFLNISRSFRLLSKAGAAGAHIEDQTEMKRCGHREGKQCVSSATMVGRIHAALDGRMSDDFFVIARTDALASEGEAATLERALAYQAAGAEALFIEAVTDLSQYQRFAKALSVPVMANMTEFGKTPLLTLDELKQAGVRLVLYPLSAFRAMNQAALNVYRAIKDQGTQLSVINTMQTREELYRVLDYVRYEKIIDQHYADQDKEKGQ